MVQTDSTYWYGVTAAVYIATCWIFSVVRGIHNCGTPKERRAYIWPDRKMQVIIYLTGTVLLPYVLNPQREAAWILMKSYFPCTYYFYCGALIFCFFGTVKQWKVWKKANFVAAIITFLAMTPLVANAWWPSELLSQQFLKVWNIVVIAVSICMIGFASVASVADMFQRYLPNVSAVSPTMSMACVSTISSDTSCNTLALQTKVLQRPVVLPHTKRILKQKNDYHKSKI